MNIDYKKILEKNLENVLYDILISVKKKGLSNNNHLYITFDTNHRKVIMSKWLRSKYIQKMTIVIQYEYWNLQVKKDQFSIMLSFDDIKENITIPFDSVISFADPSTNFGLKIKEGKKNIIKENKKSKTKKSKIIQLKNYKKN